MIYIDILQFIVKNKVMNNIVFCVYGLYSHVVATITIALQFIQLRVTYRITVNIKQIDSSKKSIVEIGFKTHMNCTIFKQCIPIYCCNPLYVLKT